MHYNPPPQQGIADRFRAALAAWHDPKTAAPELLPVRLARACVAVVPVDGAGLSVMNGDLRVPLGASDDTATAAERFQFTQGEGPCLAAARSQRALVAGPAELERDWPYFTQELFAHTPYRSLTALPLFIDAQTHGALDVFFIDPISAGETNVTDLLTIVDEITNALRRARHAVAAIPS